MICQMRPRMRCSLPSERSVGPMLTTEQPMPLAEAMTMLLFSVIWKLLSPLGRVEAGTPCAEGARRCEAPPLATLPGLLSTRSSMVSGTESLMSLESTRPSAREEEAGATSAWSFMIHTRVTDLGTRQRAAWCRWEWECACQHLNHQRGRC